MRFFKNLFTCVFASVAIFVFMLSCEKHEENLGIPDWKEEAITDFDADYNFYVTLGTMPSLYAGLHVLSHDKPSYMFYGRPATFNADKLPDHVELFKFQLADGATDADDATLMEMCEWMKDKIHTINKDCPDATFAIYMDDFRARIAYYWFASSGIDYHRVKVTMLSDGTGTYNEFFSKFGQSGDGKENWRRFAKEVRELNWDGKSDDPYKGTRNELDGNWHWCYYLSTHPYYRYLMHDGSLLDSNDAYVNERMKDMHIWSQTPFQMLEKLTPERHAQFFDMASFDSSEFDRMFDESAKPNLVILGTNPGTNDDKILEQKNYTRQVYDKYKDEYDIFFKPHPSDKSSASYEEDYPGLKILPRAPFEMFLWKLGTKMDILGGYQTTSLLTAPKEKVKFLFHSGPADMPKPLDKLFANADVEWMGK